jgi:hypothetical protein
MLPDSKLKAVALVLGLPLTLYSLPWISFKPAKQLTDCWADLYLDASKLDRASSPQQQLDHIEAGGAQFFTCNENVDPRIGNIAFLQQQNARWREGKY